MIFCVIYCIISIVYKIPSIIDLAECVLLNVFLLLLLLLLILLLLLLTSHALWIVIEGNQRRWLSCKRSKQYCCLFVCFSGPATDDKHCFDCLLVSTINLLGPGRTQDQNNIAQCNAKGCLRYNWGTGAVPPSWLPNQMIFVIYIWISVLIIFFSQPKYKEI